MSDYSKITNFLSKDSLSLNDPAKYVKGSEIDAEFNAIAVAIANKADTASPTLTTPILGVATATSINKITLTQPATGATLTLTDGKTFSVAKTLTLTGTDGTTMTFPGTSASVARIDEAQTFAGLQTFGAGLTVSGAAFNSRGITDNATAKALTLSGSGANSVTIANSATNPTIGTSAGELTLQSSTGAINIAAGSAVLNAVLSVNCTGTSGATIQIVGNGATTPNKSIRVLNGLLDFIDSAYANTVMQMSDVGSLRIANATAIPSGGTAGVGLMVSSTANFGVFFGSGAPSLSAAKGSLYLRSDGSATNNRMYVNTDGGTTWTAVTTAA